MNNLFPLAGDFEEIERSFSMADIAYRLVYLRPNPYSEEALVVGVLLNRESGTILRTVQAESAYITLTHLFGESGRDQIQLALDSLHRYVDRLNGQLESFESPTDIISLGNVNRGICDDSDKFAHDLLEISSSLYRSYASPVNSSEYVTQDEVSLSLFENVTKLNALKATTLFKGLQVRLSMNSFVKIPISGDKIIGGAVSLVTKQVVAAKNQAEAQIARYSIASRVVNKQPVIYVLTPRSKTKINHKEIDNSLSELHAIADGLNVWVRHERDLPELAEAVLRDEVA